MNKKPFVLAVVAAAVVLAAGAAIAWAATDGTPRPAARSGGSAMTAMHAGMDEVDVDRMIEVCERLMQDAGMPTVSRDHMKEMESGMMGHGAAGRMGGGGMMGDGGGMMKP